MVSPLLILVAWTSYLPIPAFQNGEQKSQSPANAVRFLDSTDPDDLAWSEREWKDLLQQRPEDSAARLALATILFQQQKPRECLDLLHPLLSSKAGPSEIRAQAGILSLYCALLLKEPKEASQLAKSLYEACLRESVPLQDRKRYAAILGELCGRLEPPPAQSPIDPATLKQISQGMPRNGNVGLELTFQSAYDASKERSMHVLHFLEELQAGGLDKLKSLANELETKWSAKQAESQVQQDVVADIREDNNERLKRLRLDRRGLEQMIREVMTDLKRPTPGHPGPAILQPIRPDLYRTQVDEYETVIIIDKDGKQKTILQRRPQWEIDQDRRLQHAILMAEYDRAMAAYRNYQTALQRWETADRQRRRELTEQKIRLQDELRNLNDAIEKTTENSKLVGHDARDLRQEEKEFRSQWEIVGELIVAVESQAPERAFLRSKLTPEEVGYIKTRLMKIYGN